VVEAKRLIALAAAISERSETPAELTGAVVD